MQKLLPGHFLIMFFFAFDLLIAISPFIIMANQQFAEQLYEWFHVICHERNSRSYCIDASLRISDCIENPTFSEKASTPIVIDSGKTKYKFIVCSRDIGIYFGMLIGMLIFVKQKGFVSKELMSPWLLIVAIAPTAIDGGVQLASSLGIKLPIIGYYESTNIVRLTTGLLAGIATGYAIIPLANAFLLNKNNKKVEQRTSNVKN